MNPVRFAARSLLSTIFITGGIDALRAPEPKAEMAEPVLDAIGEATEATTPIAENKVDMVKINAGVQVAGGALLFAGKAVRPAALALAGSLVLTTFGGHRFWEEDDDTAKSMHQIHFFKNAAIVGGLLWVATDVDPA